MPRLLLLNEASSYSRGNPTRSKNAGKYVRVSRGPEFLRAPQRFGIHRVRPPPFSLTVPGGQGGTRKGIIGPGSRHPRKLRVLGPRATRDPWKSLPCPVFPDFEITCRSGRCITEWVYMPSCICMPFVRGAHTCLRVADRIRRRHVVCTLRIFDAIPPPLAGGWEREREGFAEFPPAAYMNISIPRETQRTLKPPSQPTAKREDRQTKRRGDRRKVDDICWGVNIYVFARVQGGIGVETEIVRNRSLLSGNRNPRRDENWIISLGVFFFFWYFGWLRYL